MKGIQTSQPKVFQRNAGLVYLIFVEINLLFVRVIVDGTILDYKAAGNDLIKQGKYAEAADKYTQVTPARKKKYTEKQ